MSRTSILSKVVNINGARERRPTMSNDMTNQAEERRVDPRKPSNERLFIQIVFSSDPDLVGTTISCQTKDVSANGMRLECSSNIPQGCKLDIWIDIVDKPGKFFLSSDVKWSMHTDNGHCELGVELNEGSTTDISAWRNVHSH